MARPTKTCAAISSFACFRTSAHSLQVIKVSSIVTVSAGIGAAFLTSHSEWPFSPHGPSHTGQIGNVAFPPESTDPDCVRGGRLRGQNGSRGTHRLNDGSG